MYDTIMYEACVLYLVNLWCALKFIYYSVEGRVTPNVILNSYL